MECHDFLLQQVVGDAPLPDWSPSMARLKMLFRKLKKGKASPDGVTAEVLQSLPEVQISRLSDFVSELDQNPYVPLPAELREVEATLIPKRARPNLMKHLRPIAGLPAMNKALGYRWLQHASTMEFKSFQTGFVTGRQSGESAWAVRRVLELATEWGREAVVLQVDLEQAFDRLRHSSIIEAVLRKKGSRALVSATYQSLLNLKCRVRLGNTVSEWVEQDHGVPQGAPESPAMFVHTTDLIMSDLLEQWEAEKDTLFFSASIGATKEKIMMSHTMYADDLILFPKSIAAAQRMLDDVQRAFASAGLRVNPDKCQYLFKEGRADRYRLSKVTDSLRLNGVTVERHEQLIFLGNCIKVKDSMGAFLHRKR